MCNFAYNKLFLYKERPDRRFTTLLTRSCTAGCDASGVKLQASAGALCGTAVVQEGYCCVLLLVESSFWHLSAHDTCSLSLSKCLQSSAQHVFLVADGCTAVSIVPSDMQQVALMYSAGTDHMLRQHVEHEAHITCTASESSRPDLLQYLTHALW